MIDIDLLDQLNKKLDEELEAFRKAFRNNDEEALKVSADKCNTLRDELLNTLTQTVGEHNND